MAKAWLPLLLNAYLAAPGEQRGHVQRAVSAYACCCDTPILAPYYRTAVTKLLEVGGGGGASALRVPERWWHAAGR